MGYVAPSIGPSGLTIPAYTDILNDNLAQFLSIFGANQYVGKDSAIYQLLSIISLKNADCLTALQYAYNQSSPTTAVGAGLDRLVKLNGIARLPFGFSTAVLTVTGTPGTVINNGLAQDVNGNQWLLPPTTIPGGGSINVTATCTTAGNITAGPATITIIATPIGGWTGVTNAAAAIPGNPIETDSQLRARQAISVALPSATRLAGTTAALRAIAGIGRVTVYENPTGSTDALGNPAHSVTAVVEPLSATQLQIATAIFNNRGIGVLTNGQVSGVTTGQTVTVNVTDPVTGVVTPISYLTITYVPIFVSISVHLLAGGTSATLAAIQNDIVAYLNSLAVGQSVVYSELYGAALNARSNPDLPTFSIRALTSGLSASPSGTTDIALNFNQVAQGVLADVIVTSV